MQEKGERSKRLIHMPSQQCFIEQIPHAAISKVYFLALEQEAMKKT